MFNLLPNSLKNEFKVEYNLRRVIVILVFLLFIQISFLVFIFPSWLISFYKEKEVVSQIERTDQSTLTSSVNLATSQVTGINTKLKIINTALEYPKAIPFLNIILSKKTRSIYINGLDYTSNSGTSATIRLEGLSETRESLLSFVKNLEGTKLFKKVDLPISNFAKDKNINFSISLTIE